mgnify:FL=1
MQNHNSYVAWLIKKQQIRKEYVASDLFTLDVIDPNVVGGRKPMIMEMQTLADIIGSGIEFIDLADTPNALGAPSQIIQVDPTGEFLEFVDPIDDFLDLNDTPVDYTGFAGYSVVVNNTEDGLEFIPPAPAEEVKFEARINFDTTTDPTESQLLENSLGLTVTLSRTAVGTYRATLGGGVDQSKLIAWLTPTTQGVFIPTVYSTTYIEFEHHAFGGGLVDATLNNVSVEVKLYP